MFIERLLNQGNAPLLERTLEFTAARHKLIAENVVNVDTPGYQQKDMSLEKFQAMLRNRVEARRNAAPGPRPSPTSTASWRTPSAASCSTTATTGSMEQLMSDQAKNALLHNMVVELLKKQYSAMENALRERVT
jgi:flagellar basal-body rod protein FlgB